MSKEAATVDRLAKRGFKGGFDPSGYGNSTLDNLTLEDLSGPSLSSNPSSAVYQPAMALTADEQRNGATVVTAPAENETLTTKAEEIRASVATTDSISDQTGSELSDLGLPDGYNAKRILGDKANRWRNDNEGERGRFTQSPAKFDPLKKREAGFEDEVSATLAEWDGPKSETRLDLYGDGELLSLNSSYSLSGRVEICCASRQLGQTG